MDIFTGASSILLLNYNNYYNRIIKQESSVTAYIEAAIEYGTFINQNFPPKDGLSTSIVLNTEINQNGLSNYSGNFTDINNGNYVVVFDPLTYIIKSRWFILDMDQIRKGQYRVALKRDVIVDYYNSIMEAESYIEKAYINTSDVAIYNSEDIAFNQIKKSEKLLKDPTRSSWIVGYYSDDINTDTTITVSDRKINPNIIVDDITLWKYYISSNLGSLNPTKKVNNLTIKVRIGSEYDSEEAVPAYIVSTNNTVENTTFYRPRLVLKNNIDINDFKNWFNNKKNQAEAIFYNRENYTNENILALNEQIIYDKASLKFYTISVVQGTTQTASTTAVAGSNFSNDMHDLCMSSTMLNTYASTEGTGMYDVNYTNYTFILTEISEGTISFTLKPSANKLQDAPYKMFIMPFNKCTILDQISTPAKIIQTDESLSLNIASEIAIKLGGTSGFLYDIQLLPYCPMKNIYASDYLLVNSSLTEDKDFNFIKNANNDVVSIIYYPKFCNFSLDIDYSITLPTDPIEVKAVGDCDMYRLCSPNYAASFEFNPVKTGNITSFNVDCTYKPFAPYIKISPNWKGLYGDDFNDTRGLILSGDFSLPVVNDHWIQYQINNKNYLNAFNRNIESVELRNKFALVGDIANAATGTVGAAAQSGWVGGIASGIAGAADVAINQYLRKDALDLTKDQFNYSLENIKALPNTLAKVSSFDYNNKIFPLIEFYSCTDQEREAYRNKLIYNGMKVMRIDKIKNFITNERHYIKAKIIRINVCCNHLANEIANELNMGVYL